MQETWVWSLGQEDPLKEEMATHSSILAGKIPWPEKPGEWGRKEFNTTEHTHTHTHKHSSLDRVARGGIANVGNTLEIIPPASLR